VDLKWGLICTREGQGRDTREERREVIIYSKCMKTFGDHASPGPKRAYNAPPDPQMDLRGPLCGRKRRAENGRKEEGRYHPPTTNCWVRHWYYLILLR